MQQNQKTHSPKWYKARKRFLIVLISWLATFPATVIVQLFVRILLGDSEGAAGEAVRDVINVLSLLAGMYGIFGWIPTIIFGVLWANEK